MTTHVKKPAEVTRKWVLIDASADSMGRVSSLAASRLIGKYQVDYTPHVDSGDHVVIINASQLKVDAKKLTQKKYYRHSGHPGSLKTATLGELKEDDASRVISLAIKGMLPKNKLQRPRMNRLHVFNDDKHAHEGQKPQKVEAK